MWITGKPVSENGEEKGKPQWPLVWGGTMRLFLCFVVTIIPKHGRVFIKVAGDELYGKFGIEFGCSDGGMSHHYLQYFLWDSFA